VSLPCVVLPPRPFGMDAQELDVKDCCYDKCTHGKPCHTCEFKKVSLSAVVCGLECSASTWQAVTHAAFLCGSMIRLVEAHAFMSTSGVRDLD
jgi:hypothetical protein